MMRQMRMFVTYTVTFSGRTLAYPEPVGTHGAA